MTNFFIFWHTHRTHYTRLGALADAMYARLFMISVSVDFAFTAIDMCCMLVFVYVPRC